MEMQIREYQKHTKLNNVKLIEDILYIDFSEDFINNALEGKENEDVIIRCV